MNEPITRYYAERHDATEDGFWPSTGGAPLLPGMMRVLYLKGVPEMCEYLCPCGCGTPHPTFFPTATRHRSAERHLWEFSIGPNGPTLDPSIRCLGGCKSHFNITDGKVIMHADSGK